VTLLLPVEAPVRRLLSAFALPQAQSSPD